MRLLAWRMEATHELVADRVVLAVVAPASNHALAASYDARLLDRIGGWLPTEPSVHDLWRALLRLPDRFVHVDSAELIADASPMSSEFKDRYAHVGRPEQGKPTRPTADELRGAAGMARMVLERVGGEGGVLAQVADLPDAAFGRLEPAAARRLHDRLGHIAEDIRRLRADELADLLHGD